MIINFRNIHINNATDKSGVLIGNNFAANWDTFTKSNTGSSGNATNCLYIIIDNDVYDFIVDDHDLAQQELVHQKSKKNNQSMKKSIKNTHSFE